MEAFEGREGDRYSTEVAEIEKGFEQWKQGRTTVEREETAVDVWFRELAGRKDALHAKIEGLRDKLHKYILYRYWTALCIESKRNEVTRDALVGIAVNQFRHQWSSSWGRTVVPKVLALQEGGVDIQDDGEVRSLVESAGITVKEQSVLAAWDTVTQPEGMEQDEEDWEESGSGDGSEGENESQEEYKSGTGGGSDDEEGDSDSS